jgi:hypothetical protein
VDGLRAVRMSLEVYTPAGALAGGAFALFSQCSLTTSGLVLSIIVGGPSAVSVGSFTSLSGFPLRHAMTVSTVTLGDPLAALIGASGTRVLIQ